MASDRGSADEVERLREECRRVPDAPSPWGQLGELYLSRNGVAAARSCFERVVQLRPDAYAYFGLGNTWLAEEKFQQAIECFEKARGLDPNSAEIVGGLGYACFRSGQIDRAKPLLLAAANEDPEDEDSHFALAKIAASEGNFPEALDRCMQILQHEPIDRVSPLLLMGDCFLAEGAVPQAENAYTLAVQVDPTNVNALAGLAQIHMVLGRDEEAEGELKTAATVDPDSSAVQLGFGNLYSRRNNLEGAQRHFERALELAPHDSNTYAALAMIRLQLDRLEEASRLAQQGLSIAPSDVNCMLILAQIAELQGRFQEAIDLASRALQIVPEHFHAHLLLARAEIARQGDAEGARAHLELAVQYAPSPMEKEKAEKLLRALRSRLLNRDQ